MRGFLQRWASGRKRRLTCSFCGRDEHTVAKLVSGPRVLICDACIDQCSAIITRERAGASAGAVNPR